LDRSGWGDAQEPRRRRLRQAPLAQDVVEPADQLRPEEVHLGVGQARVGEDIAAADVVLRQFPRHRYAPRSRHKAL
jgi:hypothetical protein